MTKLPKGPLKVIHINRRAVSENETRARVSVPGPHHTFVPPIIVRTKTGRVEGFGLRLKGEVRLCYDLTRFTPGYEYGTPDVRVWIETNDAIEVADRVGEFDAPVTPEENSNG